MAMYRQKIEARQYTGDTESVRQIRAFVGEELDGNGRDLFIGTHIASPGDWIIKGISGEFYPCKPDIFAASYEAVD